MNDIRKQLSDAYDRLDKINGAIAMQEQSIAMLADESQEHAFITHLGWLKTLRGLAKKEISRLEKQLFPQNDSDKSRDVNTLINELYPS